MGADEPVAVPEKDVVPKLKKPTAWYVAVLKHLPGNIAAVGALLAVLLGASPNDAYKQSRKMSLDIAAEVEKVRKEFQGTNKAQWNAIGELRKSLADAREEIAELRGASAARMAFGGGGVGSIRTDPSALLMAPPAAPEPVIVMSAEADPEFVMEVTIEPVVEPKPKAAKPKKPRTQNKPLRERLLKKYSDSL
jgi:hypothetical protein